MNLFPQLKLSDLRRLESAMIGRIEILTHLVNGSAGLNSIIALAILPDVLPRHQKDFLKAEIAESERILELIRNDINKR